MSAVHLLVSVQRDDKVNIRPLWQRHIMDTLLSHYPA